MNKKRKDIFDNPIECKQEGKRGFISILYIKGLGNENQKESCEYNRWRNNHCVLADRSNQIQYQHI